MNAFTYLYGKIFPEKHRKLVECQEIHSSTKSVYSTLSMEKRFFNVKLPNNVKIKQITALLLSLNFFLRLKD